MGRPQTSEWYAFQRERRLVEDFEWSDRTALSWTTKNVERVHEVILQDWWPRNNGIRNILGLSYGA